MRNKLALVVAVVLGLIAVYGVSQLIQKDKEKYEQQNKTVRVAAASKRIVAGTIIDRSCLLTEQTRDNPPKLLPGIAIPEAAATSQNIPVSEEDRLIGLPINRTVEMGEQLLVSDFRQPVETLDKQLHLGQRAITLRVDAITGVASNLAPGSHVDIIGTFPLPQAAGGNSARSGAAASRTILLFQNVTVVALDSRTRDETYVSPTGGASSRTYSSATVAVTPLEANVLVFAQQYGTLTLALRPSADSQAPAGEIQIDESNLLKCAADAEKARQERLKNSSPIEATPAP